MKIARLATDVELAYAAGIIDGEGCISIFVLGNRSNPQWRKPGDVKYQYKVTVKMVDPDAITLFSEIFGGNIYMQKPRKRGNFPQFTWNAGQQLAASCLRQVLPYLRIKKHRAEMFLKLAELCKSMNHKGRGYKVPEQEVAVRAEIMASVKAENQRTHLTRMN